MLAAHVQNKTSQQHLHCSWPRFSRLWSRPAATQRGRSQQPRRSELLVEKKQRLPALQAAIAQDISPSHSPSRRSSSSPSHASTQEVVRSFFDALNARDIGALLAVLAEDVVHQDLAHEHPANSKMAVARFYLTLFASMASNMKFVVEDITEGASTSVGVMWHVAVEGRELPLSKGLGFYKFNQQRKISFVRQSPEHFVKMANLALSATGMASPFVSVLGPAATPSFWSNMIDAAAVALSTSTSPATDGVQQLLGSVDSTLSGLFSGELASRHLAPHDTRAYLSVSAAAAAAAGAQSGKAGPSKQDGVLPQPAAAAPVPTSLETTLAATAAKRELGGSDGGSSSGGGGGRAEARPASSPQAQAVLSHPVAAAPLTPVAAQRLAWALSAAATAVAASAVGSGSGDGDELNPTAATAAAIAPSAAVSATASPSAPAAAALATPTAPPGARPEAGGSAGTARQEAAEQLPRSSLPAAAEAAAPLRQPDPTPAPTPPAHGPGPVDLSGIWSKVPELSHAASYERALDLWQINGMQRVTARLIEGIEIQQQGSSFRVHHLTPIPYFKVTECYDLQRQSKVMRRDLRSGHATATARLLDDGRGVALDVVFGQPFPGRIEEEYRSPQPGLLHVTSTVHIQQQSVQTLQVYQLQANVTKQQFIRQSEQRNGSHSEILRRAGAGAGAGAFPLG